MKITIIENNCYKLKIQLIIEWYLSLVIIFYIAHNAFHIWTKVCPFLRQMKLFLIIIATHDRESYRPWCIARIFRTIICVPCRSFVLL